MGYGEIVAHQIKGMIQDAEAGIFSQEDMRRNAETVWSTVNDADREEALRILNNDLPSRP